MIFHKRTAWFSRTVHSSLKEKWGKQLSLLFGVHFCLCIYIDGVNIVLWFDPKNCNKRFFNGLL